MNHMLYVSHAPISLSLKSFNTQVTWLFPLLPWLILLLDVQVNHLFLMHKNRLGFYWAKQDVRSYLLVDGPDRQSQQTTATLLSIVGRHSAQVPALLPFSRGRGIVNACSKMGQACAVPIVKGGGNSHQ